MSYFFEVANSRLDHIKTVYEDWIVLWGMTTKKQPKWDNLVTQYAASDWSPNDRWTSPYKANDGTNLDRARGFAPSLSWEDKFAAAVVARRALLSV